MTPTGMQTARLSFFIGTVSAALAVALGAFGAHALKASLSPDLFQVFETGVRYQMYHAFGLMAAGCASALWGSTVERLVQWATRCFAAGTVLFSGSLYVLSLSGQRWPGVATPVGGALFIAGWCILGIAVWRTRG